MTSGINISFFLSNVLQFVMILAGNAFQYHTPVCKSVWEVMLYTLNYQGCLHACIDDFKESFANPYQIKATEGFNKGVVKHFSSSAWLVLNGHRSGAFRHHSPVPTYTTLKALFISTTSAEIKHHLGIYMYTNEKLCCGWSYQHLMLSLLGHWPRNYDSSLSLTIKIQ